jgi:hypothetical protein
MTPRQRARNLGSNFTTFRYAGKNIAYLESVADSGQRPVGNTTHEFIHPLGYDHPQEILTPRAIGGGTLVLTIRELWHQEVWQQMACTKIITPPDGRKYGKTYHRCVIVDVPDGETFTIETLSAPKAVTVAYTHTSLL